MRKPVLKPYCRECRSWHYPDQPHVTDIVNADFAKIEERVLANMAKGGFPDPPAAGPATGRNRKHPWRR